MYKTTVKCVHNDKISVEVGCDGPSLPITTLTVDDGHRVFFVLLYKEHLEELTKLLQKALAEM